MTRSRIDSDLPASSKGRQRHEAILDAAEALLIDEGYAGFSTRKLAERLGMRLSNVQYYFGTTGAVIEALCARALDSARRALESEVAADLDSFVRYVLDNQADPQTCRLFWELWALSARDADVARIVDGFYVAYREAIAERIDALVPIRSAAKRQRRAVLVMALLEGLSLFRGSSAVSADAGAALDRDIMTAVHMLAALP